MLALIPVSLPAGIAAIMRNEKVSPMAKYEMLTCGTLTVTIASNDYYFTVSRDDKPVAVISRPYWNIGDRHAKDWRKWNASLLDGRKLKDYGFVGPISAMLAVGKALGENKPVKLSQTWQD